MGIIRSIGFHDPDDEDDEDIDVGEPDDPDEWRDEAEDKESTDNERADFYGWPII